MSSTNFTIGFGASSKPSSKVLRPPGGGSSDIFGNDMPATPRSAKNHMASNIFGSEQNSSVKVNGDSRRAQQKNGGDSYSRLFGEPERPFTSGNNHMKSSIPIGGGSPTKNGNGTISSSSSSTNGGGSNNHNYQQHQNGNGNNNGTASTTSSEYHHQNGVSKTENNEETENFAQAPTIQSVETSNNNNSNSNLNNNNNNSNRNYNQNTENFNNENSYYSANNNNYSENVTTTNISTDNNNNNNNNLSTTSQSPTSQNNNNNNNNNNDDDDTKSIISPRSQKSIIPSDVNNNEQNNDENNSLKTIPEVDNDQMNNINQSNENGNGTITTNPNQNNDVNIINNNNMNSSLINNQNQPAPTKTTTSTKKTHSAGLKSAELTASQHVNHNNINLQQNGDHYTTTRSGSNKSKKHNEFSSPRRDGNGRPIDSNGAQIPISHRLTNMNNPNRSPRSFNPRNPVTGLGIERSNNKPRKWADHKDGNPVTGEGYKPAGGEINTTIPCLNGANQVINKNRIPPGGFSSGLW